MISHEMNLIFTLTITLLALYITISFLEIFAKRNRSIHPIIRFVVYLCFISLSAFTYKSRFSVNINILLHLVSTFGLLSLYHMSLSTKVKISVLSFVIFAFGECVVMIYLTHTFVAQYPDFFSMEVGFLLSSALSKILSLVFVKIIVVCCENLKKNIILNTLEILVIPFSTMYILVNLVVDIFSRKSIVNQSIIITFVLLIAINIQSFILFDKIRISEKRKYKEEMIESHASWYAIKEKELIEYFNRFCKLHHNFNYQLMLIKGKISQNNPEILSELDDMIVEILGEISSTKLISYSKNPTINYLLNYKSISAWNKNIEFRVFDNVEANVVFDEGNFYTLLGNALDNSIENFDKNSTERKIDIHLIQDKANLLMEVVNPYSESLEMRDELPITKKKNSEIHGFGVSSMKQIVEDKGGSFRISASKGIFSLQIILYDELH